MTAQEQVLATNVIKNKIRFLPVSRLCSSRHSCDETVDHLVSGSSYLTQSHYKALHNQVTVFLHWQLCKSVGFNVAGKWWSHIPERVLYNSTCKISWDFIVTD